MPAHAITCECHGLKLAEVGELGSLTCCECGEIVYPDGASNEAIERTIDRFSPHMTVCGTRLHQRHMLEPSS